MPAFYAWQRHRNRRSVVFEDNFELSTACALYPATEKRLTNQTGTSPSSCPASPVPKIGVFIRSGRAPSHEQLRGNTPPRGWESCAICGQGPVTPPRISEPETRNYCFLLETFSRPLVPPAASRLVLKTSGPGMFTAGGVRPCSVKRVVSAVGEGPWAARAMVADGVEPSTCGL